MIEEKRFAPCTSCLLTGLSPLRIRCKALLVELQNEDLRRVFLIQIRAEFFDHFRLQDKNRLLEIFIVSTYIELGFANTIHHAENTSEFLRTDVSKAIAGKGQKCEEEDENNA